MAFAGGYTLIPQSTGAPGVVNDYLYDITRDASRWGYDADRSLSSLNRALSGLGEGFSPPYDFTPPIIGDIPDFSGILEAIEGVEGWTSPGTPPSYRGPTTISPVNNPIRPPGDDLGDLNYTISFTPNIRDIPNMAVPAQVTLTPVFFTRPAKPDVSDIDDLADYTPPDEINPDLSVLGFGSMTPPDEITVTPSGVVFPPAPNIVGPTYSTPTEIAVYRPGAITWGDVGDRPLWDVDRPTFTYGGEPGDFTGDLPDAPNIVPPTMPVYTGPDDPVAPDLAAITIPVIRDVPLPEIDISIPVDSLPTLTGGLAYTDPGYSDSQVDQLRQEISRVLNGDVGIPAHLWDAIWDKAGHQIVREGVARERQGRKAWAKLGWSMPGGVALAQQEQAAFDINQQLSEKARELAIQRATMEREDFWQAVQQGVAFQKVMMDLYNAFQERQLRAEIAINEAMVNIYNANVSRYNTNLQRVQSQVAVAELELRGALSQLEVDKGRMEGAKVEAEVQQQITQVYVAKWEAVRNAVSRYQAFVEAKKTELDAQRLRVQTYGEEVKAHATKVDVWAKQWDGYVAKIEAEKAKAQVYETEARVFSERMKGYSISSDAEKSRIDAQVRSEQLMLEQSKTEIDNFRAKWSGLETALTTQLRTIDARLQEYSTTVQAKTAEAQTDMEAEKLKVGLYEADIGRYSAEVQGAGSKAQAIATLYAADAERYRSDVQGASAVVEASARRAQAQAEVAGVAIGAYSAEIDAEKAGMQAQISANELHLERYKTEAEVNKAVTDVSAYRAQTDGKRSELELRREELRLDKEKSEYQAKVEHHKSRAIVYEAGARDAASQNDAKVKEVDAARAATEAQIAAYDANVRAETARMGAQAQVQTARATTNSAKTGWAEAKARVEATRFEAKAQEAELVQRGMIESAKLEVERLISLTQIQVKGLESIASVYAQLTAGAYSAASVSASIGDTYSSGESLSEGASETHNYSYEGVAPEA
jgi:hypothetical protein